MDKALKRKIRRLWRDRVLLGVCTLALFGSSVVQVQAVLRHRPQQPRWVLELSQAVETFSDEESSVGQRQQAQLAINTITKKHGLTATDSWAQAETRAHFLVQDLERVQALSQGLAEIQSLDFDLARIHALVRVQSKDLAQALARSLSRTQSLEVAQSQAQKLAQSRAQTLDLDLAWTQELNLDLTWTQALDLAQAQSRTQSLSQNQNLNLAQVQELAQSLSQDLAQALPQAQALSQDLAQMSNGFLVALLASELEAKYGLTLQQGSALEKLMRSEPTRVRAFLQAIVLLGISVLFLSALLLALVRLQGLYRFPPTVHLVAFLPEECVAELGALQRRMKKAKASPWQIRLRLLEEFVTLLWVFFIQVQLENLTLPSGDRKIDDD